MTSMSLQEMEKSHDDAPVCTPEGETNEQALARRIGKVLRELRKRRDLSLNELASLSGVSRSMLSQMETGKSVPSVLVMLKVARAFDVPLSAFIKSGIEEGPNYLSVEETRLTVSPGGKCAWRFLMPEGKDIGAGFFELTLRGQAIEKMPAYADGIRVSLTVNRGSLSVALAGHRYRLNMGDVLEFPGSSPHAYINTGNQEMVAYLVLRQSRKTV